MLFRFFVHFAMPFRSLMLTHMGSRLVRQLLHTGHYAAPSKIRYIITIVEDKRSQHSCLLFSLSLVWLQCQNAYCFSSSSYEFQYELHTQVLCTVLFCLAGCAWLPQNFSGCYCKILEVKIKIGKKKVARATRHI